MLPRPQITSRPTWGIASLKLRPFTPGYIAERACWEELAWWRRIHNGVDIWQCVIFRSKVGSHPLGHAYFICWITESPHFKSPSEKKIKVPHYNFSRAFFSLPRICVANKKKFSVDHIGRAYKSAIPRGRLKCSAVLLLETSCARQPILFVMH
jgi:hypothetical protein